MCFYEQLCCLLSAFPCSHGTSDMIPIVCTVHNLRVKQTRSYKIRLFCYQSCLMNVVGRKRERKTGRKTSGVNRSPKGLRLKERDVANGSEEGCYERKKGEGPRWENKDNACVCVIFVTVAFWRTEGLFVCIRFPIHSICGIDPLCNSEQNKTKKKEKVSLIQPLFITQIGERRGRRIQFNSRSATKASDREMRKR